MGFEHDWLIERVMMFIPLLLSLCVHEWAHAWAAWKLGDDTARLMGRLTLNPIAHIDPVGTLLLPLLGVPFGWAKPVPFNPLRFTHRVTMRTGTMLVALAGPISNLVLALGATVLLALVIRFGPDNGKLEGVSRLLQLLMLYNVILAVFNMLPIPPLDGSKVVDGLLPRQFLPAWEKLRQFGPIALAAVILLPMLSHISLFAWPVDMIKSFLGWLLTWLG